VTGGEDAFVTSVYALMQNAQQSRFHVTALPFIERLAEEANYLEQLRGVWEKRTCSPDQLPDNKKLRQMLGSVANQDIPL
jgi:peptidase E